MSQRRFLTIDGHYAKPDRVCGYCWFHHGLMTETLCRLHNCQHKFNGRPCNKLDRFEWIEDRPEPCPYKGEAYREHLRQRKKKHGKHKSRRNH